MEMHLDVTTLRLSESAIGLLLALLSAILWSRGRMFAGFGYWTLAKVFGTAGYLIGALLKPSVSSTILMGLVGVASLILNLESCRRFFGSPPQVWLDWGIGVAYLAIGWYLGAELGARQALMAATLFMLGVIYGWAAGVLFTARSSGHKLGKNTTAIAFTVLCLIFLVSGIEVISIVPGVSGTPGIVFGLVTELGMVVAAFGFFLMHYERLLYEREEQSARTASLNRDLTDLKTHLEETVQRKTAELIRSQKLESIGRLAGGMAHDFNNLLAVVHGHANLIQAKMPHLNPLRGHVDKIVNVCEEASSLTERLLAFGQQKSFEPGIVQLNDVVHKVEGLVRDILGDRIELVTSLSPDLGCALVDRGQLRQVLMNLVLNARDAMPSAGTFNIATENADLNEALSADAPAGQYVVLTVSDSGCGMNEEIRSRIFEPFFTTKGGSKGSGLGLSTVYGIVKQSGGHIHVESEPFQGTTFRVFLPRVPEEAVMEVAPVAARSSGACILVVEDYKELRALIGEVLREAGHTVLEAATGTEALSVLRDYRGQLDLVMTDLAMPEMDGQTFAEQVRRDQPDLKIVFMSAYPEAVLENGDARQARIPVLRKPFTDEDLTARVREVLNLT
jgi:signal transduction histidine kinase/CheY-like chemotaxis protein